MSAAFALLREADAAGCRHRLLPDGRLRAPAAAPPDLLTRLRAAKLELRALLRGDACRRCGEAMGWPAAVGVVLGDGTALHHACRYAEDLERARNALAPLDAEAELMVRGEPLP